MAKIVCIDIGTKRFNNNLGDVVSIHDDQEVTSGGAYSMFKIYKVEGLTAKEVKDALNSLMPEIAGIFKIDAVKNEWSLIIPTAKMAWKNLIGEWCFLEKQPKYAQNMNLMQIDYDNLKDTNISKFDKIVILSNCRENIKIDPLNLIEVPELNK